MKPESIEKAAAQFGRGEMKIEPLGGGLINQSFKVQFSESPAIVLQSINQQSFRYPENIISNYVKMEELLRKNQSGLIIPTLLTNRNGKYLWEEEDQSDETTRLWRATQYLENSYSASKPESAEMAGAAASMYARFTKSIRGSDLSEWKIVIPDFHNLSLRYRQFEEAVSKGKIMRLIKATHMIASLRERHYYVLLYEKIAVNDLDFPIRLMHHDSKISNILFYNDSGQPLSVVDLDTVMPGKFFSDLGDMIRSMACTVDENSSEWEKIDIDLPAYKSILTAYSAEMEDQLTEKEKELLPMAGPLIIYMQALRFTTDYLNNDIYYKTEYPEQNLNRAFNQLILLENLEALLKKN